MVNVIDNNLLYSWLAITDFTYYHYKRWWVHEIIILSDLTFPSFVHIYKHYIAHVKNAVFIGLFLKMAHLMIMMYNQTCKIASENHILSSKHSFNWIINCLSIENPKFSGLCHASPTKQLSQEPTFTSHWSMFCCASLCLFLSVSIYQWSVLEPSMTEATLYRRHWDDWCLLPGVNKSPSPLTRSSRVLHKDSSVSHLKWSVRLQKKKTEKKKRKPVWQHIAIYTGLMMLRQNHEFKTRLYYRVSPYQNPNNKHQITSRNSPLSFNPLDCSLGFLIHNIFFLSFHFFFWCIYVQRLMLEDHL